MGAPESETHRWAALQQENGELQEDVVERDTVEREADDPDLESEESFPASDAPSSWAGPDPEPRKGAGDRVVHSAPVEGVPERDDPGAPVPGTLPR